MRRTHPLAQCTNTVAASSALRICWHRVIVNAQPHRLHGSAVLHVNVAVWPRTHVTTSVSGGPGTSRSARLEQREHVRSAWSTYIAVSDKVGRLREAPELPATIASQAAILSFENLARTWSSDANSGGAEMLTLAPDLAGDEDITRGFFSPEDEEVISSRQAVMREIHAMRFVSGTVNGAQEQRWSTIRADQMSIDEDDTYENTPTMRTVVKNFWIRFSKEVYDSISMYGMVVWGTRMERVHADWEKDDPRIRSSTAKKPDRKFVRVRVPFALVDPEVFQLDVTYDDHFRKKIAVIVNDKVDDRLRVYVARLGGPDVGSSLFKSECAALLESYREIARIKTYEEKLRESVLNPTLIMESLPMSELAHIANQERTYDELRSRDTVDPCGYVTERNPENVNVYTKKVPVAGANDASSVLAGARTRRGYMALLRQRGLLGGGEGHGRIGANQLRTIKIQQGVKLSAHQIQHEESTLSHGLVRQFETLVAITLQIPQRYVHDQSASINARSEALLDDERMRLTRAISERRDEIVCVLQEAYAEIYEVHEVNIHLPLEAQMDINLIFKLHSKDLLDDEQTRLHTSNIVGIPRHTMSDRPVRKDDDIDDPHLRRRRTDRNPEVDEAGESSSDSDDGDSDSDDNSAKRRKKGGDAKKKKPTRDKAAKA